MYTIFNPLSPDLDERDAVLHAKGCHQLLIHWLVTVLTKDAEQGLPLVQSLECPSLTIAVTILFFP
jgi:hypothetical protein